MSIHPELTYETSPGLLDIPKLQRSTEQAPVDFSQQGNLYPALLAAIQNDASTAYNITYHDGDYWAENEAHGLHIHFRPEGIEFTSHVGATSTMQLLGCGYEGDIQPVAAAERIVLGNRIEYRRGNLTEWYLNGPLGLEQGFTLQTSPSGNPNQKKLIVDLAVGGTAVPSLESDSEAVVLKTPDNANSWAYRQLYVTDTAGSSLPVTLDLTRQTLNGRAVLRIMVDDVAAQYPVVIDPFIQAKETFPNDVTLLNSIAFDGDTFVAGDPYQNNGVGAAYVFVRSGASWSQQAKLIASDGGTNDHFGNTVAISGDTIAVGTYRASWPPVAGVAYVFVRNGTAWTQQQKLLPSDSASNDNFGKVTIDGDTIVVGAPFNASKGAAYAFVRSGTSWTQQQKLIASDGVAGDGFGGTVALRGNTVFVAAAAKNDGSFIGAGAEYVFVRSGTIWSQQQKLLPSDSAAYNGFGSSTILSSDGNTALIGADRRDSQGRDTNTRVVYIFVRNGTTWSQQAELSASDGVAGDYFGGFGSLSNDANTIFIGATTNGGLGAIYVFIQSGVPNEPPSAGPCIPCIVEGIIADVGNFIAHMGNDQATRGNPISLNYGEKREAATDLILTTPAGPLSFSRTYRQSKQSDPNAQLMGLGWTHNQNYALVKFSSPVSKIVVRLPSGGEPTFVEVTTNHFQGVAGVDSFIDFNSGTNQYTLTALDKSTFVFNSAGQLLSRTWPSGEVWTYTYTSGKLSQVDDGYGRKLVFRYYNGGSFNGQLYRVGDQTFDDSNPNSPTGRYVEYSYTLNQIVNGAGSIVNGTGALLTGVRDVRGNTWAYTYYGQNASETDTRQLNFLIKRQSPTVDTT